MKTTIEDIRRDIVVLNEMTTGKFGDSLYNGHIDYADCIVYCDQHGFTVVERRKPGQSDENLFYYSEKWSDPEVRTDA